MQPEVILVDFYSDVVNGVIDINGFSYITNRERMQVNIQLEKEKHTSNKFVQYVFEFCTREKYISVDPYVYSKGIIRYRNIQLIKMNEENEQTEILKNPVEECLISSEDNLIDVNCYQISNRKQFYDL